MPQQLGSFIRYPGGKQRMLTFLRMHLPSSNEIEGMYFEPFVGGGAVFLNLQPRNALISDVNPDLIAIYQGIKESPCEVWAVYCKFGSTKLDYHSLRIRVEDENPVDRAARMLYLNRTCFKGMWRHNRQGDFNVGYGGQARRWVISEEYLLLISDLLTYASIECGDFELFIECATGGDFIFVDPPYKPGEREQSNTHYLWQRFRFEDYERLAKALNRSNQRGVMWAMTISSHPDLTKLFQGNYSLAIPSGTSDRPGIMTRNSREVLISNYHMEGSTRL